MAQASSVHCFVSGKLLLRLETTCLIPDQHQWSQRLGQSSSSWIIHMMEISAVGLLFVSKFTPKGKRRGFVPEFTGREAGCHILSHILYSDFLKLIQPKHWFADITAGLLPKHFKYFIKQGKKQITFPSSSSAACEVLQCYQTCGVKFCGAPVGTAGPSCPAAGDNHILIKAGRSK